MTMDSSYKKQKIINYLILSFISFFTLTPFCIMLVMGTYKNEDLFTGFHILPGSYLLQNLKTVFNTSYLLYYRNSLIIGVSSTLFTLLSSSLCGYALAKYKFRLRKAMQSFVLATLMVPGQLGLIAFVWQMRQFGWTDTFYPLILPALANSFGVFWMSQYIKDSVPDEVIESARVDGSGEFRTFFQIVIPYIKPALVALALLYFVGSWNNFLGPLVILTKPKLFTIPIGITALGSMYRLDYAARILGLSLRTFPIIILFISSSKAFLSGITVGAIKG